MIVVMVFIRSSCTSWQWLYWIKLFHTITVERKTL